jgi:hypothetical protein
MPVRSDRPPSGASAVCRPLLLGERSDRPNTEGVACCSGACGPTWEGLLAQGAAIVLVLGSYVLAETLRKRKRRAILEKPSPVTTS